MKKRTLLSFPLGKIIFLFLVLSLLLMTFFVSEAFQTLGFGEKTSIALIFASLFGSTVNIPVHTMETKEIVKSIDYRSFFNLLYPKTEEEYRINKTTIAINLGGALVPVSICVFLFLNHVTLWWQFGIGIGTMTFISYLLARPIAGVGITMPTLLPPILAAVIGLVLPGSPATVLAYVSGVLGVIIGADLLNLREISKYRTEMLSIGGAGTFDGIFLTGIVSVLLAAW